MALTYAFAAVDAIDSHPDDLEAMALAYDAAVAPEADGVYRESAAQDRYRLYRWKGLDIPADDAAEMERQELVFLGVGVGPPVTRCSVARSSAVRTWSSDRTRSSTTPTSSSGRRPCEIARSSTIGHRAVPTAPTCSPPSRPLRPRRRAYRPERALHNGDVSASDVAATGRARLGRDEWREHLLDAAAAIATDGSVDDVTIEAVAERAAVSRPLLYKHFANRDELLGALYRREATRLDEDLTRRVADAKTLDAMFEALIEGALAAAAERGPMFAALRSAGGWTRDVRREQRARDATTSKVFAAAAKREGLDPRRAGPATAMLLTLVDAVLAQWRAKPTPERAAILTETYLLIVRSTLASLAPDPTT